MNTDQTPPRSSLTTAAVLLSPLAVLGAILIAIAVGHDFLHFAGEMPIALGLCAPAAYLLIRWFVPYAVVQLRADAASPWPAGQTDAGN